MKKIYVVGLGPGRADMMTYEARKALEASDIIIGYHVYIDLIREDFKEKEFLSTPMTQEIQRCELAFEKAREGYTVSMICSGDAGVYGMASPMIEIGEKYEDVDLEIISGISAVLSGAALLGAPLTHDFAVISLSDLLTDWNVILNRLEATAKTDFVICIYNPSSKKRHEKYLEAIRRLLAILPNDRPCGVVKHIGREGQEVQLVSLEELLHVDVDMFTTIFIGKSDTKISGRFLMTPRGYESKYGK